MICNSVLDNIDWRFEQKNVYFTKRKILAISKYDNFWFDSDTLYRYSACITTMHGLPIGKEIYGILFSDFPFHRASYGDR